MIWVARILNRHVVLDVLAGQFVEQSLLNTSVPTTGLISWPRNCEPFSQSSA